MLLPIQKDMYTNFHFGISGQFGDGGNAEVHYLQTSLKMKDLESIKLLVDIPGSEKWGVKDLFQRTIDRRRIKGPGGLEEYFKDKNQLKYFNPITLVLLPVDDEINFNRNLEKLREEKNIDFEGTDGISLTNKGVFRLIRQKPDDGRIGKIEWNSDKCYVVAVDGQHRLTALKELHEESMWKQELREVQNWEIPVVFLVLNKKLQEGPSEKFVSLIRKIFMYINEKAERVNDARAILLNDESIECVCVQEFVGIIHENDNFESGTENRYPPLYLVDWIGAETSVLAHTRYLFNNLELRAWMKEYLIGEDIGSEGSRAENSMQFERLDLLDLEPDFLRQGQANLSFRDSEMVRVKFNQKIRGPFIDFLTGLTPIKDYIQKCRKFESENSEDAAQIKAFAELRYGYAKVENSYEEEYQRYRKNYKDTLLEFKKETMSEFFRQDICIRGFVYAYSRIFDLYKSYLRSPLSWQEYTGTFMNSFNNLIEEGWCEGYEDLDIEKQILLTHICHDDTGRRVRYKIKDVSRGWGVFVMMHVLTHAASQGIISKEYQEEQWITCRDFLQSSLESGFRDVVRRELAQKRLSDAEKKTLIDKQKEERALKRLQELEELWSIS